MRGTRRQFCHRLQARVCATVQQTVIMTRRHERNIASALSAAAARETKLAQALAVRLDSHSTLRELCHRSWTQLCATVRAHSDSQNRSQCRGTTPYPPVAPTEKCFAACAFAKRLNCEALPHQLRCRLHTDLCATARRLSLKLTRTGRNGFDIAQFYCKAQPCELRFAARACSAN